MWNAKEYQTTHNKRFLGFGASVVFLKFGYRFHSEGLQDNPSGTFVVVHIRGSIRRAPNYNFQVLGLLGIAFGVSKLVVVALTFLLFPKLAP
jgi:hypothetical protein